MIMRITWGKLRPGSWNEFERTYNATVAVKGRTVKGLRGRWLLPTRTPASPSAVPSAPGAASVRGWHLMSG